MSTVAAAVGETLAVEGVSCVFGVVGNGNIVTVDALVAGGARYVAARHEGGAMMMADAYARATGNVGVCSTTYGPGLTNVATPLVEAAKSQTPVLVVAGDSPVRSPQRSNDIDQTAFVESLGATSIRLTDPATARADTAAALRLARTQRRAVVLGVPADLLDVVVDDAQPGTVGTAAANASHGADGLSQPAGAEIDAEIDAAVTALAAARRPLVLAGRGVVAAGAGKTVTELGDRLGALFATTTMANGLFAGHPATLGVAGGFGSPRAAALMKDADVVLALGASLNMFTTSFGHLVGPDAVVIQVDLVERPTAVPVLRVRADVGQVVTALLDRLGEQPDTRPRWRDEADLRDLEWRHEPYTDAGTADRMDPRTLSIALADLLPPDRTIVTDGGHFVGWPVMYWPSSDSAGFLFTGAAFQSIGLGLGSAVGAAAGRPDRTTVVALGDGGTLMGISELETLIRVGESVLVVIYNDAAFGAEMHQYGHRGIDLSSATFPDTDFVSIAQSMGAAAATVRDVSDLAAVTRWRAAGSRGTLVLDCKIVREVMASFMAEILKIH